MNFEILYSKEKIQERIKSLSQEIKNSFCFDDELIIIGVLNGSFIFLSDLVRNLKEFNCIIDFIQLSSYGSSTTSSGNVKIKKDINIDINQKNILIVEDIIDTGLTMNFLVNYLKTKNPKSIKTCTLLDKKERREVEFNSDYCGFIIPNYFVIGYGLDYNGKYRHFPYIAMVKEEQK